MNKIITNQVQLDNSQNRFNTSTSSFISKNNIVQTEEDDSINKKKLKLKKKEVKKDQVCLKFTHLAFCSCFPECSQRQTIIFQVIHNVYVGNLSSALMVDKLKLLGIKNILKVMSDQYTQQTDINYLQIQVYDAFDEDLKKNFRISNRYISSILEKGQKVLIHDENGDSVALVFCLAFMINNLQIPLKMGLDIIKKNFIQPQINSYFISQLEQYDIEKISNYRHSTIKYQDSGSLEKK